jgi:hypothetical protein
MTETLSAPSRETVVDNKTIAEINSIDTESASDKRLREARDRLTDLLDEHDPSTDETDSSSPDAGEAAPVDATREMPVVAPEDDEQGPEKKRFERTRGFFKKMGKWAVTSLEANGFIPIRGTWHKRNGVTGFVAKSYVWNKQRKEKRLAGFLSEEADSQLNGEAEGDGGDTATSHEANDDSHEDEADTVKLHRRLGRAALNSLRKAGRLTKKAYRTWKEIKNVAK